MTTLRFATTDVSCAVRLLAILALAVMALGVSRADGGVTAAGSPAQSISQGASQEWLLVVDRASILDEGQERSAIDDAFRLYHLYQLGSPVQVWTENTALNQAQADVRANALRVANRIESAPGRDDGLLIYLSVDPRDDRRMTISFSVGANALPQGGLTLGDIETIREAIAIPQLEEGHPARAIVYSIREMIYQQVFTPPPSEPTPKARERLGTVLGVTAPVVALVLGIWTLRWRSGASWWIPLVVDTVAATLLAVLAVVTRSEPGVASAVLLGAFVLWQAVRRDRLVLAGASRHLRVTPRPPVPGHNTGAGAR